MSPIQRIKSISPPLHPIQELHCDVSLEQSNNHKNQPHHHHHHQQHIRNSSNQADQPTLTAAGDAQKGVGVAAGKSKTQPVQFSFTLYDLDGHGKITKDDIAGIVSTIYESLGKSVVVPHYGSKTINVRLTVSPDAQNSTAAVAQSKSAADKSKAKLVTPRRRYRPRKLLSDDENSDSSNELLNHKNCMSASPQKSKSKNTSSATTAALKKHNSQHNHRSPMKSPLKEFSVMAPVATVAPILTTPTLTETNLINLKTPTNSIYMNMMNLDSHSHTTAALYDIPKHPPMKVCPEIIVSPYHEPAAGAQLSMMARHQQMLMQQKEQRKKQLRKTRSRKQKVRIEKSVSCNRSMLISLFSRLVPRNDANLTRSQFVGWQ